MNTETRTAIIAIRQNLVMIEQAHDPIVWIKLIKADVEILAKSIMENQNERRL